YTPLTLYSSHAPLHPPALHSFPTRRSSDLAGIDPDGRKQGPHAFRSSLASSMVNDNIPYEVVRKTLGHTDQNAIRSYARLDLEQDRKSTRLNSSHVSISYAVFCLKKKTKHT